jgi:hypothetical protein
LDHADSTHAIGSVKPALIWQVILVIEDGQILKMCGDVQQAGNDLANGRERLRPDCDLDHMDLAASRSIHSHSVDYIARTWPVRLNEHLGHNELAKKELGYGGLCPSMFLF